MIQHLFFDLDRTLWDFEKNSRQALLHLFEKHQLEQVIKSFESFHNSYKNHNARLWTQYGKGKISKEELRFKRFRDTLQQFQIFDTDLAVEIGEGYIATSPHQTNVFPNTHQVLDDLQKDGYRMHIITNGFKEVQFIKLEKSGLLQYFDLVLCSEEVGVNKPDPAVFLHALEYTGGTAHNSIMIGDDLQIDVLGAEKVGMKGVLFDPHRKYKHGTHEWHIQNLQELPEKLIWMNKPI